jgi:hypothetical protein
MGGGRHIVDYSRTAGNAALELAEVDIEILGLGGPVLGGREIDAGAGSAALLAIDIIWQRWRRRRMV